MRGEKVSSQSSLSAAARSLTMPAKSFWYSFTQFTETTSAGSLLYTATNPKADLRCSSGQFGNFTSSSCLQCRLSASLVQYPCLWQLLKRKNRAKCFGPFPKAVLCKSPSIAMSLRVSSGARFQFSSASFSVSPTSLRIQIFLHCIQLL